ncbi:hypothetical protein Trydic_g21818 [Trypoxylus dichotomus]
MVILQLEEQPPLIQAIFSGEVDTVRKLLESKEDVNYQDFEKRSALHAAAFRGDPIITRLLIDHGARVNMKDCKWVTPLHRACYSGSEETVTILLNSAADTCARDRLWQTPLHIAAACNSAKCVSYLLDRIQNPNVTDRSGRTALHHAVLNGHNEIVELLISRGCIVNACDKKDCRPMHWAAYKGHADTIEILLQRGADINAQDRNQYTPLHVAAASGAVSVVDVLIGNGADVEAQNAYGNTPLHVACLNGHGSFASELLRYRTDKQATNFRGQTPLHLAAASTHGVHCLNLLVNHEADINRQSLDGRTPLHMTAIYGRFTRSKTLIDKGAIVDCVDSNGCTALHIAAHYGHELLSNTLLSYGASPSRKGFEGRTPLHMCCLAGYIECCRIFIKAGVDLNDRDDTGKTPLHCAAYKGAVECVDLLVSSGADFRATDNVGRTALHYAAAQGFFFCVFTLVGIGSPVNQADQDGCTALHLAAAYDIDGRCVNYLIEHKADPKVKDAKGFTPIHYAVAGNNVNALKFLLYAVGNYTLYGPEMPPTTPLHIAARNGNVEMLEKLMPYFPDPNVRNEYGCSALLLAARHGYANCVQMLLRSGAKVSICDVPNGLSPVHHSAKNGHVHCLALLVDNAEDKTVIDLPDSLRRTALMLAVSNSHVDCATTLVRSGADPNIVDGDGHSCLFRAVVTGQHNILQMLLPRSATVVNERDAHGKTALHVAAGCGRLSCVQRLLPYMRDDCKESTDNQNCTALHWACYAGSTECVAHFFNEGIFKRMEGNAFSPVHCAASVGSEKCLKLLRSRYGPEIVRLKDERARTPLHVAALHGQCDCAKFLVAQGADVDDRDEDGKTPLISAAFNGQAQIIETLIDSKADVTLYDKNGNTALHTACLRKHSNAALLLLERVDDPKVINAVNNECKTALHLTARNGLVGVTRQLIAKGASVTAVDANGLTPALCCAPNPNVAQCLAIILANHTAQTAENGKDPHRPFPAYLRTDSRTSTTTLRSGRNQTLQTDITLLRDPDQFELEKIFEIKFEKTYAGSPCASPPDDDAVTTAIEDDASRFFIHYKTTESGGTIVDSKGNYAVRTSAFELHGSQSDTVLAPKPIYSDEDYEKMVKQGVQEDCMGGDVAVSSPLSVSARHLHRNGRRKSKTKDGGASERRCKTLKCCDDRASCLESFKSRSAASVLTTFRCDTASDFISVGRGLDSDREYAEMGVGAVSRRKMERAVDALERRMRINGAAPRTNRFPKSTNKRLKQQQHEESAEATRETSRASTERCHVCKQSLSCCSERDGVDIYGGNDNDVDDNERHNIPLETMQMAIEKVLTQKGCATNRCLLAFLDESYELNAKNAHYIYHGMLSPKCEPYIAKCLNLTNERGVEIVENVTAATPSAEEEGGGAYFIRKKASKSAASPPKLTANKIPPWGFPNRSGGGLRNNGSTRTGSEKQGKLFFLGKQHQQSHQTIATKENREQLKMGDANCRKMFVGGDARSKALVPTSHAFHGARRSKDRRSANAQRSSTSSKYCAATMPPCKLEQVTNQIQKVQSEKTYVAKLRKIKNLSCADIAHQNEPAIHERAVKIEAGCGEKSGSPIKETIACATVPTSQPFPDYLKSLTNFRHLDSLGAGNDDSAGIVGSAAHVRCYSTYWCFPEVTDTGGGAANQEGESSGNSEAGPRRQIPSGRSSFLSPIPGPPHLLGGAKSESAMKRARIELEIAPVVALPFSISSAEEFLRACTDGSNDPHEMIYFNGKLIEESSCDLQLSCATEREDPSRDDYEIEKLERLRRLDEDGGYLCSDLKTESDERTCCALGRRAGVTNIKGDCCSEDDVRDWCEDLEQFFTNSRRKQLAADADRLAEAEKINVDDWKRFAAKNLEATAGDKRPGARSERVLPENKRMKFRNSDIAARADATNENRTDNDRRDNYDSSACIDNRKETYGDENETKDDRIEVHYDNRASSAISSEYCVERRFEDVVVSPTPTTQTVAAFDAPAPKPSGEKVDEISIFSDIPTAGEEEHLVKSTILNEHSQTFLEEVQGRKEARETISTCGRRSGQNKRILIRKTDDANDDDFIMKKPAKSSETTRRRKDEKAINWKLYMAHRCLQLSDNMNVDDHVRGKAPRRRDAQPQRNHCLLRRKHGDETNGDFRRKRSDEENDNLKTSFQYSGLKIEEYEGTVRIDDLIEKENVDGRSASAAKKVNFPEGVRVLNDKATVYAFDEEAKRTSIERENLDEWLTYIEEGSTKKRKGRASISVQMDPDARKRTTDPLPEEETDDKTFDFVDLAKKTANKSFLETIDIKDFVQSPSTNGNKNVARTSETATTTSTETKTKDESETIAFKDPSMYMKEFIDIDLELDKLENELTGKNLESEGGGRDSPSRGRLDKEEEEEIELDLRDMYDYDFAWQFESKIVDEGFVENTDTNPDKFKPTGERYFCDMMPAEAIIDEEEEPDDPLVRRVDVWDEIAPPPDVRVVKEAERTVPRDLEQIVEEINLTDCRFGLLDDVIEPGKVGNRYGSEEPPETDEEDDAVTPRGGATIVDEAREETGKEMTGECVEETSREMDNQDDNRTPLLCLDRCSDDTFAPESAKEMNEDDVDECSEERAQSDVSSHASEEDDLNIMDSGFSHIRNDGMSGLPTSGGDNNQQGILDGRFSFDTLDGDSYDGSIERRRSSHGGEGEGEEIKVMRIADEDEQMLTTSCEKSDEYQDANLTDAEDEEVNDSVFYDTESETSLVSSRRRSEEATPARQITSLIKIDIQEHLDKIVAEKCTGTVSALQGGGKKNASQKSVHFNFKDGGDEDRASNVVPVEFEDEPKSWASLNTIYHVERENPRAAPAFIESNSDMNCLHAAARRLHEKISLIEGVADSEALLVNEERSAEKVDDITGVSQNDGTENVPFNSDTNLLSDESSESNGKSGADSERDSSKSNYDLERREVMVEMDRYAPSCRNNNKFLNTTVTIMQVEEDVTFLARQYCRSEGEDIEEEKQDAGGPSSIASITAKIDEICEEIKIEKEDYDEICRAVHFTPYGVDELVEDDSSFRSSDPVKDLLAENVDLTMRQAGVTLTTTATSSGGSCGGETKKTVKINRNVKIDDIEEYVLLDDRKGLDIGCKKSKRTFPSVTKLGKKAKKDSNLISLNTDDLLFLSYLNGSDDNLPLRLVGISSNSVGNLLAKAAPADDATSHHSSDNEFY